MWQGSKVQTMPQRSALIYRKTTQSPDFNVSKKQPHVEGGADCLAEASFHLKRELKLAQYLSSRGILTESGLYTVQWLQSCEEKPDLWD